MKNKISENIKILFLIFFVFALWMYFFEKFNENKIEEIKYLFMSWTIFFWYLLFNFIFPKIIIFLDKIKKSKRTDIIISIYLGLFLILLFYLYFYWLDFYSNIIIFFKTFFENITIYSFVYLLIFILVIWLLVKWYLDTIKSYLNENKKENNKKWILISDKSIKTEKDENWKKLDKLWMNDRAKDFAKTVWNDWSEDSFIFWLIAPWWHWKTSFLNLFEEELNNKKIIKKVEKYQDIRINKKMYTYTHKYFQEFKYKNKYEIFKFNPWYFESEKSLLEKFLTWISSQLSSKYFLPKLDWDLKSLVKFLQDKWNGILSTNFNFSKTESLEEIKENINSSLKDLDKKLIIIIDDLDRFTSEKLKVIFKILDLCKDFHNTTYILCYDQNNFNNIDSELKEIKTQNIWENNNFSSISTENIDNKNLVKYIAKIINIQYPIYPDYEKLKEYFKKLFTEKIWLNFSPNSQKWIEKWIDELYNLENFRIWWEYISDIRSIKRIANNLIAINSVITKEKDFISNLFDEEAWWLIFSNFFKLSILSLNFNHLYLDIYNEIKLESNEKYKYYLVWTELAKYKFEVWSENKKVSNSFYDYIKWLNSNEENLLRNLFKFSDNSDEEYIKTHISYMSNLDWYINILEVNKNSWFNRFIKDRIEEYKNNSIDWIIEKIEKEYEEKGLQEFINRLKDQLQFWENWQEKTFEFIDYALNNFYNNYLISCSNIVIFLEKSVWYWNFYSIDKHKKIRDYFYWEWEFLSKQSIIEKLFNDNWWVRWIKELLYMTQYFNEKDFRIFTDWMWNQEYLDADPQPTVRRLWINKSAIARYSREFYKVFKEKYIDWWKNIFEEIIKYLDEHEELKFNKSNFFTWTIIFLHNTWIYDESEDLYNYNNQTEIRKDELINYYFEKCFVWEDWISYFLNFLWQYTYISIDSDDLMYESKQMLDILPEEKLLNYINKNRNQIENFIDINKNTVVKHTDNWWEFKATYQDFWEIFKKEFNLN